MKRVAFKAEITLGNVLQIAVMVAGITAYFVNNEHRLTNDEAKLDDHEKRIVSVESVIEPHYPMYRHNNKTNEFYR